RHWPKDNEKPSSVRCVQRGIVIWIPCGPCSGERHSDPAPSIRVEDKPFAKIRRWARTCRRMDNHGIIGQAARAGRDIQPHPCAEGGKPDDATARATEGATLCCPRAAAPFSGH